MIRSEGPVHPFSSGEDVLIVGIDEAGRGCLAGPVVAAAVILQDGFPVEQLNDSKKLSVKKRKILETYIKANCIWAVGESSHTEIDEINILQASLLAMERAYKKLPTGRYCVLVDGNRVPPGIAAPCTAVVQGDAIHPCIMAASILAKTHRDHLMTAFALSYPLYGYEQHKGYPTVMHRTLCQRLGPSPIQRRSFRY